MMRLFTLTLVFMSQLSYGAANPFIDSGAFAVKGLIQDALNDGSAEGVVSGNIAAVFQNATKSNEPVTLKIKRIKKYEGGCGRLHVEIVQSGVKTVSGKPVQVNPSFEFSICPNGMPPKEVRLEQDAHRIEAIKKCSAKTVRGDLESATGLVSGEIELSGCPSGGRVQLRYTGSCPAIQMPIGQAVNYSLSEAGALDIQLRVPEACLRNEPAYQNQWSLMMIERDGLILGDVVTAW